MKWNNQVMFNKWLDTLKNERKSEGECDDVLSLHPVVFDPRFPRLFYP